MNDNENMTIQDLWDWVKVVLSAKREVHSNISLPQETRKTSKPNLTPKANRKTRTKKKQKFSRRKWIIKIKAEISENKWRG